MVCGSVKGKGQYMLLGRLKGMYDKLLEESFELLRHPPAHLLHLQQLPSHTSTPCSTSVSSVTLTGGSPLLYGPAGF